MNGKPMLAIAVIVTARAAATLPAIAHPLGNFTINHYAAIEARPDGLDIGYVLDMAEIPTFQELGHLEAPNMKRHLATRLTDWAQGLHVMAGHAPVPLRLRSARVSCLPGAGGLPTLRIEEDLSADYAVGGRPTTARGRPLELLYRDANFPERVGWKEIVVMGGAVRTSSVPSTDRGSNRLRSYPVDLLRPHRATPAPGSTLSPSRTTANQSPTNRGHRSPSPCLVAGQRPADPWECRTARPTDPGMSRRARRSARS